MYWILWNCQAISIMNKYDDEKVNNCALSRIFFFNQIFIHVFPVQHILRGQLEVVWADLLMIPSPPLSYPSLENIMTQLFLNWKVMGNG